MKMLPLFVLLGASLFGQSQATHDLEREISHVLLLVPEHTIFDSIQFQLSADSKVTLDGQVTSELVKEAAERDVKTIPGVAQVVNNLKVLPLSETDDQIRTDVLEAMRAEPSLKVYARRTVWPVHVVVNQAAVTLEGVVYSDTAKTQAGIAANSVPAVSRVINRLRVVSSQAAGPVQPVHYHSVSGEEQ